MPSSTVIGITRQARLSWVKYIMRNETAPHQTLGVQTLRNWFKIKNLFLCIND
ncbi:hypothetical protein HK096_010503 [Nowakowskiella sp. JEL0078]|nr:hypothetical protein HK096_010503 [Nowakowskiella sp. JEL0078]